MSELEITSIELEALTFTYGEEALTVLRTSPLCIKLAVPPHTGAVDSEQYVNATLLLTTSANYPAEAPIVQLQHPQGMSDARIDKVITRLRGEAQNLLGEMMLGSLIEAAKDSMTELNEPEGHCIFCLDDLVPAKTTPSQQTLLRLPCYHCYHLQCFAGWWHWQQAEMHQKAAQMKQDLQSAAPQRLQEEGLVPNADGLFPMPCPVCRLIFVPESVPHIQDETKFARHNSEAQQAVTQLASGFTPTELTKLALEKQKRAKQFAKQQQQGGIVAERYGTSIAAQAEAEQAFSAGAAARHEDQHSQLYDRPQQHSHQQQHRQQKRSHQQHSHQRHSHQQQQQQHIRQQQSDRHHSQQHHDAMQKQHPRPRAANTPNSTRAAALEAATSRPSFRQDVPQSSRSSLADAEGPASQQDAYSSGHFSRDREARRGQKGRGKGPQQKGHA